MTIDQGRPPDAAGAAGEITSATGTGTEELAAIEADLGSV
jgi:hypothetical protein